MERVKKITLLGATGSIGASVLSVVEAQPERYKIYAVVAKRSAEKLAKIALKHKASHALLLDEAGLPLLRALLSGSSIQSGAGAKAIEEIASHPVDLTVAAIVGAAGIRPAWAALRADNQLALANKECLVSAGPVFMEEARQKKRAILPIDSEHNAIWQVFEKAQSHAIERVTLTASGGPFHTWRKAAILSATPEQTLRHPKWRMGEKITVDSASLMNKGLELIEAKYLFTLKSSQLKVLIHPQSIVHGMVHYRDGSVLAGLGCTDMRLAIAYCLNWPARGSSPARRLELEKIAALTFEAPDLEKFPSLTLAYQALEEGIGASNALNAANEIAVAAFLDKKITFGSIPLIVDKVLQETAQAGMLYEFSSIEEALFADAEARQRASRYVPA